MSMGQILTVLSSEPDTMTLLLSLNATLRTASIWLERACKKVSQSRSIDREDWLQEHKYIQTYVHAHFAGGFNTD